MIVWDLMSRFGSCVMDLYSQICTYVLRDVQGEQSSHGSAVAQRAQTFPISLAHLTASGHLHPRFAFRGRLSLTRRCGKVLLSLLGSCVFAV